MRSFAWDDFDVPEKVAEDEDGTEGSKRKKRRKEKEAQLDEAKIRHREESLAGAEKGQAGGVTCMRASSMFLRHVHHYGIYVQEKGGVAD